MNLWQLCTFVDHDTGRGCRKPPVVDQLTGRFRKRCAEHGGRGGPKTAEGRRVVGAAVRRRWDEYRAARAAEET